MYCGKSGLRAVLALVACMTFQPAGQCNDDPYGTERLIPPSPSTPWPESEGAQEQYKAFIDLAPSTAGPLTLAANVKFAYNQ